MSIAKTNAGKRVTSSVAVQVVSNSQTIRFSDWPN